MVQVRRLLDVLPILSRREDERRFGELPFARPASLCVLLGKLQGVQGPVVEQHKPILSCLRPFLIYSERDRSPHVAVFLVVSTASHVNARPSDKRRPVKYVNSKNAAEIWLGQ